MEYSLFRTKKMAADKHNLEDSINLAFENFAMIQKDYKYHNVKNFGRLLEVVAYYHEVDQHYRCVGFEVEYEYQFEFERGDTKELTELKSEVGFYSTWVGKSHPASPITFEESYQPLGKSHRFSNGLGDHVEVVKVLVPQEEVQKVVENMTK